jgi:hypothetical protein
MVVTLADVQRQKLLSITKSGIGRLTKAYDATFQPCKELAIRSFSNQYLRRVTDKLRNRFHNLKELNIASTIAEHTKDRWRYSSSINDGYNPFAIHCDVVPISAVSQLEHISFETSSFVAPGFRDCPRYEREVFKPEYAALRSLTMIAVAWTPLPPKKPPR